MHLTRRTLLAGLGIGLLGAGGLVAGGPRPQFTEYAYAATDDVGDQLVRVAWYERYNGAVLESHDGATDAGIEPTLDPDEPPLYVADANAVTDVTGPVVTLGNLLPGDRGTLVVGFETVESAALVSRPVDVWLQTAITADEEHGINGPETLAGDVTADGELDEQVFVELWRDTSTLGGCNGKRDFAERLGDGLVSRAPVRDALGQASLAGSEGLLAIQGLQPGTSRCVALTWTFPESQATNRSQGDAVTLDLAFVAVPAGTSSPFAEGAQ